MVVAGLCICRFIAARHIIELRLVTCHTPRGKEGDIAWGSKKRYIKYECILATSSREHTSKL